MSKVIVGAFAQTLRLDYGDAFVDAYIARFPNRDTKVSYKVAQDELGLLLNPSGETRIRDDPLGSS